MIICLLQYILKYMNIYKTYVLSPQIVTETRKERGKVSDLTFQTLEQLSNAKVKFQFF